MRFGSLSAWVLALGALAIVLLAVYKSVPAINLYTTHGNYMSVGYLALKYLSYTTWCYYGSKWLTPKDNITAMTWGAIRLVIGIALAFLIITTIEKSGFTSIYTFTNSPPWAYLGILLPARWFEWWILEVLISKGSSWPPLLTLKPESLKWRMGGIIISFLADAPVWFSVAIAIYAC